MCWYPGKDPTVLAPYVEWFWRESLNYFQVDGRPLELETSENQVIYPAKAALIQVRPAEAKEKSAGTQKLLYWFPGTSVDVPALLREKEAEGSVPRTSQPVTIQVQNFELHGRADERSMVATGLVIFALCFFSIYVLPALTCEERERGVLLAQVLSPASTTEILMAKFLFYPTMGMALGVVLAAIYSPVVVTRPFFWLSLVTTAVGYLGVGLTIASLARTQRLASMGAMCYMLTVALLLFITQRFGIPSIQFVTLEYYCPRIMHAALQGETAANRLELGAALVLVAGWNVWAAYLFRRRGWQ
jgi:ABC-type Na+ efflux pump permease subunit